MARTLTPAEWAELERAQREGGIPNVAPDSSVQIEGRHNPWGDLPTQQEQVDFRRRTTGYPRGGLGGILDRVGAGVQEEFGQAKDWVGGLLDRPADLPVGEQPEWMSPEDTESAEAMERDTGVPANAMQFLTYFNQALRSGGREAAQEVFDRFWPYLTPNEKMSLNEYLYNVK